MQPNSIDPSTSALRRRFPQPGAATRQKAADETPPSLPVRTDTVLDRLPASEPSGDSGLCEWFAGFLGYPSAYCQEIEDRYESLLEQCGAMPATVTHAPWLQARVNHLIRDLTHVKQAYIELVDRPRFMAVVVRLQATATHLSADIRQHVEKQQKGPLRNPLELETATNPAAVWSPPPLPDLVPQNMAVKAPKRHTLADPRGAGQRIQQPERAATPVFTLSPADEIRLRTAIDVALQKENGKMLLTDLEAMALGREIAAVAGGRFAATSNDPRFRRNTPESTITSATERMRDDRRETIRDFANAYIAEQRDE